MSRSVLTVLFFVFMSLSGQVQAQSVDFPENAEPRANGIGWKCSQGYRRDGDVCARIDVPVNASLSIDGRNWRCDRGYERVGDECSEIPVPANADLRLQGTSWYCLKGFERADQVCDQIIAPANAVLTWGGSDWRCLKGYKRVGDECRPSGAFIAAPSQKACPRGLRMEDNRCRPFAIPQNATYTDKGDDWTCMNGFAQQDAGCVGLSDTERMRKRQYAEIAAAIDAVEISLPGGLSATIGDIREACSVVAGEGTYDRFDCADDRLGLVETGCYVRNDSGTSTPIECPSYRFRPLFERCFVRTHGDRTRLISCPSAAFLARLDEE